MTFHKVRCDQGRKWRETQKAEHCTCACAWRACNPASHITHLDACNHDDRTAPTTTKTKTKTTTPRLIRVAKPPDKAQRATDIRQTLSYGWLLCSHRRGASVLFCLCSCLAPPLWTPSGPGLGLEQPTTHHPPPNTTASWKWTLIILGIRLLHARHYRLTAGTLDSSLSPSHFQDVGRITPGRSGQQQHRDGPTTSCSHFMFETRPTFCFLLVKFLHLQVRRHPTFTKKGESNSILATLRSPSQPRAIQPSDRVSTWVLGVRSSLSVCIFMLGVPIIATCRRPTHLEIAEQRNNIYLWDSCPQNKT